MLDFKFSETSQNLSSFKPLLFSSFHRGDQRGKPSKTGESPLLSIFVFPFVKIEKVTCDFNQTLKQGCLVKCVLNNYVHF